jgi:hypothetical protein
MISTVLKSTYFIKKTKNNIEKEIRFFTRIINRCFLTLVNISGGGDYYFISSRNILFSP